MVSESILFALAGKVLGELGSVVVREISLAMGVRCELEKLTDTLSTIQSVLLDAEERQKNSTDQALGVKHQVNDWLRKLKEIVYDIDDLVDEFHYFSLKRKVRSFSFLSNPSTVFRFKMGNKIKKIIERLEAIAAGKAKFNLREQQQTSVIVDTHRIWARQTHSFVHASNVIGRNQDKETIVEHLMKMGPTSSHNNVSIMSIVGIGGLGKTTLAKMVYNDERISDQFHPKIWVCVSNEFKAEEVMKKIIQSATGEKCSKLDINELQIRLRDALNGKKYLLVLDDVWSDDRVKRIELWELLISGARGSKIVVTTRSKSVATSMGTNVMYKLQDLPHDECVSLFLKWAFEEGEEKQKPELVNIGRQIVKKCKGLPLAVKTLGSMLFQKPDEHDWLFVRDNEIWKLKQKEDDILPALKLSYNQLPSYLKQCFAFCSIFSKNCKLDGSLLIYLWISQGFIQLSDQSQDLEGVGKKYLEELMSRSFFHEVEDDGVYLRFKMHDLIHDLALYITKSECAIVNSCADNISEKVRHVAFSNVDPWREDLCGSLMEQKKIRTIYFQYEKGGPVTKSFVEACISRFKRLRDLDLSSSSFEELPSSIGNLKHLRYLNISQNQHIKLLPNSICKVLCLQSLLLVGCVKFEKLPSDIGKLINLRCLGITTHERSLAEGIRNLSSLRNLNIQCCENLASLSCESGIQHLSALQMLCIYNCGNLFSLSRKGLRRLTMLKTLVIDECKMLELNDDRLCEEIAKDPDSEPQRGGLRSLQKLIISAVPKLVALPRWLLQDAAAVNILRIQDCAQLMSLPEGMHLLRTLRELHIAGCSELIRRCQRGIGEDWHKIAHVPNIYLDGKKI